MTVRTATAVVEADLRDLLTGRIAALRIPGYASPAVVSQLRGWLAANRALEPYTHEIYTAEGVVQRNYGVYRFGRSFNTTYGAPPESGKRGEYYQRALPSIQTVRQACAPYLSPIDRLRVELDEQWQHGAQIATYEGDKMFCGIVRLSPAEESQILESQPHVDCLPPSVCELDTQLSANIYVDVPEEGGELEVWDVPQMTPAQVEALPDAGDWRASLPGSSLIHPRPGDLVFINTRKPHAVRSFKQGVRSSVQSFIGHIRERPLRLWC